MNLCPLVVVGDAIHYPVVYRQAAPKIDSPAKVVGADIGRESGLAQPNRPKPEFQTDSFAVHA